MPLNPLFDQLESDDEQQLLADLYRESIEIAGDVVYYLPRRLVAYDPLYGEDDLSTYDAAYLVPAYIVSLEGYQGDRVFMSKFGIEIRDRIVFELSRQMFEDDVGSSEEFSRPREGDVIFFPRAARHFEVKFVEYLPTFYPLGSRPGYRITCEVLEYSNQRFSTGVEEIDAIQARLSTDLLRVALRSESGSVLTDDDGRVLTLGEPPGSAADVWSDDAAVQERSDSVVDFTEENPFNDGALY